MSDGKNGGDGKINRLCYRDVNISELMPVSKVQKWLFSALYTVACCVFFLFILHEDIFIAWFYYKLVCLHFPLTSPDWLMTCTWRFASVCYRHWQPPAGLQWSAYKDQWCGPTGGTEHLAEKLKDEETGAEHWEEMEGKRSRSVYQVVLTSFLLHETARMTDFLIWIFVFLAPFPLYSFKHLTN